MAQFRSLAAEDVRQILDLYGVGAAAYRAHQPIAAGTINTNVRVELAQGVRFLRVNEGKSLDDVTGEAVIVAYLSARGVPTPAPIATAAGEPVLRWRGEFVSLFPWLPGRTLSRMDITATHARQAGAALGQLHLAGAAFPDHREGRYVPVEIDRRLARVAAEPATAADPLLTDAVARLRPELARLAHERRADLPTGLIHGDLFVDNVLFDGDQLVALLDFEQASWGRLSYDLAVTVLAFGFGRDDFRRDVVAALLEGYAAERPLTAAERDGFGPELRFAACRFAVTRITDVYLKRSAGAAPGKDFRRYLLRLARAQEHLAANDGLLAPP